MNSELRKQVESIFTEVLNTALVQGENPRRNEISNWDSLKHMELILCLEEQFHIRFSIREVAGIQSFEDLVAIIGVKQKQ